ncbi:Long-chain-fatty-acid--CoA ligase 5 [Araneus ventricosus]|uniref:long-chain-fatty-acid--CoA ligase n=1 Tax=Araneus ventricosus TaxID=182803 RepID=A0A4Y2C792_ARAVE|nr:Long-chain-fatty-acid--CoA ligase 5 [Araneus ventricosus]
MEVEQLSKRVKKTLEMNRSIIAKLQDEPHTFYRSDSIISEDQNNLQNYPPEFLYDLTPSGMPPHALMLKKGAIVMLLRNFNPKQGLCNGTLLSITGLHENFISAKFVSEYNPGGVVFLTRIELAPSGVNLPFVLKRRQFPLIPVYAMTINKSHGQTFDQAQCLIRSKFETDAYDENLISEASTISACKPFIDSLGGKLRIIISGGAPIYKNVVEFYTKIVGPKVLEIYGQTECAGPCSVNLLDSSYDGSVGAPLPCCLMKVVDVPDMGYFSKDSKGEVCVKGHCVFKGYLKDPAKTAEALDEDGWLHTGDIGMWLPVGF